MSRIGAAPRAAVPVSDARAEASRKNGARSRGPQAAGTGSALAARLETHPIRPAARPPLAQRPLPDEPERAAAPPLEYLVAEPPAPVRALHEPAAPWLPPAAPWLPKEPEPGPARHAASAPASRTNPEPYPNSTRPKEGESRPGPRLPGTRANPSPVADRAGPGSTAARSVSWRGRSASPG